MARVVGIVLTPIDQLTVLVLVRARLERSSPVGNACVGQELATLGRVNFPVIPRP